jgi:hypothetical protein
MNNEERSSSKMRLQLKQIIGVLGLAAVAAMLVAAVGASPAGASEWKTSGRFPVNFLGEGLGLSTFQSTNNNLVICHNSHTRGEIKSATLVKVTITYLTGCELIAKSPISFKEACPTITTKELDVEPLSNLNGGGKTGLLVLPAMRTVLTSFTCTGVNKVKVEVRGSVICESTPIGVLVLQSKVIYKKQGNEAGVQEFTTGTLPEGKTVTAGLTMESTLDIFKATEKDSLETTRDVIYNEPVEQSA